MRPGAFFSHLVLADDAAAKAPQPIVLKADHLFDSISGKLVDHGIVVVAGAKIQAVGADAQLPANAKVIDLGAATLLPGFIDAHVHMADVMSPNWYRDFYNNLMRFPAEQALYGAQYAKQTLLSRPEWSPDPEC